MINLQNHYILKSNFEKRYIQTNLENDYFECMQEHLDKVKAFEKNNKNNLVFKKSNTALYNNDKMINSLASFNVTRNFKDIIKCIPKN